MNYAESALRNELAALRNARPGQRNTRLNRAAYALGQLVGAGLLASQDVHSALTDVALGLGMQPSEIRTAVQSGLRAGQQQPRNKPSNSQAYSQAYRQPSRMPQQPQQPQQQPGPTSEWVATATETLRMAQAKLPNSQAAAYALARGLSPETLIAWGCGAGIGPKGQPTLCWPLWGPNGTLTAIRHRLLGSGSLRYLSESGSRLRGATAGMPMLWADRTAKLRTIAILEGELNAMSAWQAAHPTGMDVMSLGSESAQAPEWLYKASQRYGAVLVWLDAPERSTTLLRALGGHCGIALHSPDGDANDGLRAGWLGARIWQARLHLAQQHGDDAVRRLCWLYWDAEPFLSDDIRAAVRATAASVGDALW